MAALRVSGAWRSWRLLLIAYVLAAAGTASAEDTDCQITAQGTDYAVRCKDGSSAVFSEGWRSVGAGKPDQRGWVISNEEGQPFRAIETFTNSPLAKGLPFLGH